jgi:hypothetical protein
MIINSEDIFKESRYGCNKHIMEYLVFEKNFVVLDVQGDRYYFKKTELLDECLDNLPFLARLMSIL